MKREKLTDLYVSKMLSELGIKHTPDKSGIKEIDDALKTASKNGKKNIGFPDYIAKVKDFILVIENKADIKHQIKYKDKTVSKETDDIINYALNGALHYSKHIVKNTNFNKVFAIGISGNEKMNLIDIAFVNNDGFELLDRPKTLINLSKDKIDEFYRVSILKEESQSEKEKTVLLSHAETLNNDLRNYGRVGDNEKALVVSAIILALQDENFNIEFLIGNQTDTDGNKILNAVDNYLESKDVRPQSKKELILNQFNFIRTRQSLNTEHDKLGKTPLRYYTEYINTNIKDVIRNNNWDVLGNFYKEFVKYTDGDGNGLGVVLTPSHITDLMCDLADLKADDVVLDPCCGTGTFLISAMVKMLGLTKDVEVKNHIKENSIYGIEIREDLYTIASTSMILNGDGKSNLEQGDFFNNNIDDIDANFTLGLMNPPYSQSKDEDTRELSELSYIERLLSCISKEGRALVIVPLSTMVGKTNNDKEIKKRILETNSLESVITLNKSTFHNRGTHTCIAIFKTGVKHNSGDRVKFINFQDDGYELKKHKGLVKTEQADDRKKHLLDVYNDRVDADESFIIKTNISPEDEWLHSYYYYNLEKPTKHDMKEAIRKYMQFEFDLISKQKRYLFGHNQLLFEQIKEDFNSLQIEPIEGKLWGERKVVEIFGIPKNLNAYHKVNLNTNLIGEHNSIAYITRKKENNSFNCEVKLEDDIKVNNSNCMDRLH